MHLLRSIQILHIDSVILSSNISIEHLNKDSDYDSKNMKILSETKNTVKLDLYTKNGIHVLHYTTFFDITFRITADN